jgi:hypothetical protein
MEQYISPSSSGIPLKAFFLSFKKGSKKLCGIFCANSQDKLEAVKTSFVKCPSFCQKSILRMFINIKSISKRAKIYIFYLHDQGKFHLLSLVKLQDKMFKWPV